MKRDTLTAVCCKEEAKGCDYLSEKNQMFQLGFDLLDLCRTQTDRQTDTQFFLLIRHLGPSTNDLLLPPGSYATYYEH